MQLAMTEIVRKNFKNLSLATAVTFLIFSLISAIGAKLQVDRFEKELFFAYQPLLAQGLLAGDTFLLEQQLKALNITANWDYSEVLQENNLKIAAYPKEISIRCTSRLDIFNLNSIKVGTLCFSKNVFSKIVERITPFFTVLIILFILHSIMIRFIQNKLKIISDRFFKISKLIDEKNSAILKKIEPKSLEEETFLKTFLKFLESEEARQQEIMELEVQKAFAQLSKQVAHDIRSPLSVLNITLSTLNQFSEEKVQLIQQAAKRINDIANDLLLSSKSRSPNTSDSNPEPQQPPINKKDLIKSDISRLLRSVLAEKRAQFQNNKSLSIELEISDEESLYTEISEKEFTRVLSNLINNSFEALDGQHSGKILISAYGTFNKVFISIRDNGPGIPNEILSKIGYEGVSFGKNGEGKGYGLGIFHAKNVINSVGGEIKIQANHGTAGDPGVGTLITIILSRSGNV